jgi:hypothetical protein
MLSIVKLLTILSVFAFGFSSIDLRSARDRIKKTINDKEPGWQMTEDKLFAGSETEGVLSIKWEQNNKSVDALIMAGDSKQAAIKHYHGVRKHRSFGDIEMKIQDKPCTLAKGKCFVWVDVNFKRRGVAFVRGQVFGIVDSEDGSTAKRFADEIAGVLSP